MLKCSYFRGETETGPSAIPLFGKADGYFEKTASADLLPEVVRYIAELKPENDSQYVLVNAMGAGEYFGCFPAGTLVETSTGEVPIEQVEQGQLVRTHENRFRPVMARTPKPAEELCDLYVRGLPALVPALTATPNHELWVVTREEMLRARKKIWHQLSGDLDERRKVALEAAEFDWVSIGDLQPGDHIAEPFPLSEDALALGDERWNCPEVAFLMGLYAAEGCTVTRSDRPGDDHYLVFVIRDSEDFTRTHMRNAAEKFGHKLSEEESPETHSVRLGLHWQEMARLCSEHVGKLATGKKLSPEILRMPRGWQRVFFHAYRSGDGCIRGEGRDEGTIRCVSASPALLRGVRLLLARQGLLSSISGRHNTKASWYNGNPIYELSVGGGQTRGRTESSRGASKSYLHPAGFILSAVKRVETYAWSGEVYDLTVEEDSSFTASGIAVHNSNINGDYFSEESLVHKPDDWAGNPVIDRIRAKEWPYGFPTFYRAHPYAHHRNKDASRAFGDVELAAWNPHMRRVELITRVDRDKCMQFGGQGTWDKLKSGSYPDVSMGTKVPFDTCSICLDWKMYKQALDTFDPKKHRHPGLAALEFHKEQQKKTGKGIQGLSITRADYCDHALKQMNKIFPDGRKVFVLNDYPSFFDISFVFIGADKTAKTMLFIFSASVSHSSVKPSARVADELGLAESDGESKTSSVNDAILKQALAPKMAKQKRSEIDKRVIPSQFAGKAVPLLTRSEPDLPRSLIDSVSTVPPDNLLSTLGGMGVLLRPREFQRLILIQLGEREKADDFERRGEVFEKSKESESMKLGARKFMPALAHVLAPFMDKRALFAPEIERRVVLASVDDRSVSARPPSHSKELLDKIGAAYNGYRQEVMELVAHAQHLLASAGSNRTLQKVASTPTGEVFSPLSAAYLQYAFEDEYGADATISSETGDSRRGEGFPLREHVEYS